MAVTDINYSVPMGRWAPGVAGRLRDAAIELFSVDGFDLVTVEQIAAAAGVTQRTFFRYFPTKEDVLFAEGDDIVAELRTGLAAAPRTASPATMLLAAMTSLAEALEPRRNENRRRAHIIRSVAALRERELLKQHYIALELVDEFVSRGIPRPRASMLAGVGMVVFQSAHSAWVTDRARTTLAARIEVGLREIGIDLNADIGNDLDG
jgi:AcrR family transcriptional regulator